LFNGSRTLCKHEKNQAEDRDEGDAVAEYRVEELAEAAGITVELLRSYQSRGLVPPPVHRGRLALYGQEHLERLRSIRDLKDRGYPLKVIAGLLGGEREVATPTAVAAPDAEEETFSLRELAERCGVPTALLRSLQASGVLRPRKIGDVDRYTSADVRAVRMLLALLGSGLPMEEFMRVARVELDAAETVAEEAVALFMRYIREPLLATNLPQKEQAERLVAGLRLMLHATTVLMSYNFQRMVLNAAQAEIARSGSRAEREALKQEALRRLELAVPA
jgi:DNA-binding transcriptional MerR regulator